ncbi:MAG: SGNH/GDSL hydrolase family protein [Acidimicrobiales bacterium]
MARNRIFRRNPEHPESVDYSAPLGRAVSRSALTAKDRWTDEQFRLQREQDLTASEVSSGDVLKVMVICLAVAALLSSAKLVEITERQEFGWQRDVTSAVARGIDRVANTFALNRPADWIASVRSQGDDVGQTVDVIDEEALGVTGAEVVVPPITQVPPPETTTTSPPPVLIRSASSDTPVVLHLAGDSQAEFLGYSLERVGTDRDGALVVTTDARVSTGLSRPDYFNWPAQLQEVVASDDPDAVVLFMGANDYQDLEGEDGRLVRGSEEWRVEYARRVAITMDLLIADTRRVFWVAQPPMRDGTLQEGMAIVNDLTRAAADTRPEVVWIDAYSLFGGDAGFSLAVVSPDGDESRVRSSDGVHLNATGADWLSEELTDEMDRFWAFGPAVPSTTSSVPLPE